jgi:hypothetical protein
MKKFEYRKEFMSDSDKIDIDLFNVFGNDGWELVSIVRIKAIKMNIYYFKREKDEIQN